MIEATYRIIDDIPQLTEKVTEWSNIQVPQEREIAYAEKAIALRWDAETAPVKAHQLLRPRRYNDQRHDVWHLFNNVQENLTKGGIAYSTRNQENNQIRYNSTRAITSVNADLAVNKGLWELTEELASSLK